MKRFIILILLPVLITPVGEFFLKHTVTNLVLQKGISLNGSDILNLISQPTFILGGGCIVLAGALWLVALSKYELSFLYPFMSLNYLLILGGSGFFLHEQVSFLRYMAAAMIVIGLIFISRSKYAQKN